MQLGCQHSKRRSSLFNNLERSRLSFSNHLKAVRAKLRLTAKRFYCRSEKQRRAVGVLDHGRYGSSSLSRYHFDLCTFCWSENAMNVSRSRAFPIMAVAVRLTNMAKQRVHAKAPRRKVGTIAVATRNAVCPLKKRILWSEIERSLSPLLLCASASPRENIPKGGMVRYMSSIFR